MICKKCGANSGNARGGGVRMDTAHTTPSVKKRKKFTCRCLASLPSAVSGVEVFRSAVMRVLASTLLRRR